MNANDNNQITVQGRIIGTPDYSHSVGAERFLKGVIKVVRTSGQADMLPFMVSERLAPDWTLGDGDDVTLIGQIRSNNVFNAAHGRSHLEVLIFVREISHDAVLAFPESDNAPSSTMNNVVMTGRLCKAPTYRVTPFGREISDMMIAVERAFGKSDHIPCIAWGRTAKYASTLKVGDTVKIEGRFQSRNYTKVLDNGKYEERTVFEVSIFELYA